MCMCVILCMYDMTDMREYILGCLRINRTYQLHSDKTGQESGYEPCTHKIVVGL